jgi:hypothetical protein
MLVCVWYMVCSSVNDNWLGYLWLLAYYILTYPLSPITPTRSRLLHLDRRHTPFTPHGVI